MDELLEDNNVGQGAAMDVFATLFIVFILILIISMMLYGGYSVKREHGYVYARFWVKDSLVTENEPEFSLNVHKRSSGDSTAQYIFLDDGSELTELGSVTSETMGIREGGIQQVFILKALPSGKYSFELKLRDGFDDLWVSNLDPEFCWEIIQPLKNVNEGCRAVPLEQDTSRLLWVEVDYDLSIR